MAAYIPKVEDKVLVLGVKGGATLVGICRFAGTTEFAEGIWIGVELSKPQGKNDGSVKGKHYFECPVDHGLFLRPAAVQPYNEHAVERTAEEKEAFAAAFSPKPSAEAAAPPPAKSKVEAPAHAEAPAAVKSKATAGAKAKARSTVVEAPPPAADARAAAASPDAAAAKKAAAPRASKAPAVDKHTVADQVRRKTKTEVAAKAPADHAQENSKPGGLNDILEEPGSPASPAPASPVSPTSPATPSLFAPATGPASPTGDGAVKKRLTKQTTSTSVDDGTSPKAADAAKDEEKPRLAKQKTSSDIPASPAVAAEPPAAAAEPARPSLVKKKSVDGPTPSEAAAEFRRASAVGANPVAVAESQERSPVKQKSSEGQEKRRSVAPKVSIPEHFEEDWRDYLCAKQHCKDIEEAREEVRKLRESVRRIEDQAKTAEAAIATKEVKLDPEVLSAFTAKGALLQGFLDGLAKRLQEQIREELRRRTEDVVARASEQAEVKVEVEVRAPKAKSKGLAKGSSLLLKGLKSGEVAKLVDNMEPDKEDLQARATVKDEEALKVHAQLHGYIGTGGIVIGVIGEALIQSDRTQAILMAVGGQLARDFKGRACFLTCGFGEAGVQAVFSEACSSSNPLAVYDMQPRSNQDPLETGQMIVVGHDVDHMLQIYTQVCDVYITAEGSDLVTEAIRLCASWGAVIIPLILTGGASGGECNFPKTHLSHPSCVSQEDWAILSQKEVTPQALAQGMSKIITDLLIARQEALVAP